MSNGPSAAVSDHQVETLVTASRAMIGVAVLSLSEMAEHLSLVQFRALVVLSDTGRLKAADLAERLGVSASSVTRLCDRLVAEGLLERTANPASRREVLLTATASGEELVNKVLDRRRRDFRTLLGSLNHAERERVVLALEKFAVQASDAHGAHVLDEWPVA